MPRYRHELEDNERRTLAPFAQFSGDTRGRRHPEQPPLWRTHYQRDRDRVIHSRAFRRLEYKTQVFLNGTADHLRTRLTHTIEVAAISRNLASALRLNTDLAETIALSPEHVSIYMMEIDEGSRLGLEVLQSGSRYSARELPAEEAMADFYELAQRELQAAGYEQYEISNWAKPG